MSITVGLAFQECRGLGLIGLSCEFWFGLQSETSAETLIKRGLMVGFITRQGFRHLRPEGLNYP